MSGLKLQYNYAKSQGWLIHFANAAAKFGHTTADLMAIASRESNIKNIIGDNGHGYSLMQLDIRSYPEFCKSGKWKDAEASIFKGASALAAKRDVIEKVSKQKRGIVKFSNGSTASFVPREMSNADLRRITIAAYNCGGAAYYHFSKGNDPDRGTTGKDYSKDVLARSKEFQELLEQDHVTPVPVSPLDKIAPPTPETVEPSNDDTVQDKLAEYAKHDTVKSIALKAALKIGSLVTGAWSLGTHGKVLIIIAGLIIAIIAGYEIYKHFPRVKRFVTKLL